VVYQTAYIIVLVSVVFTQFISVAMGCRLDTRVLECYIFHLYRRIVLGS